MVQQHQELIATQYRAFLLPYQQAEFQMHGVALNIYRLPLYRPAMRVKHGNR
jgi:hypothetical protein